MEAGSNNATGTQSESHPGTEPQKDRPCCLKRAQRRRKNSRDAEENTEWSWIRFLSLFGIFTAIILFLHERFVGHFSGEDLPETLGAPLLLAMIISWLLASHSTRRLLSGVRQGVVWWVIIVGLVAGFTFKAEMLHLLDQVMASLVPRFGYEEQPGSMTFYRAANGHFYIEALINRQPVSFLVDTGASGIVLPPRTARKLGFRQEDLIFNQTFATANGNVRVAAVVLNDLRLGDLHMQGVAASVNGSPMRTALLGMQFFNKMLAWEVKGNVMTVRWRSLKDKDANKSVITTPEITQKEP